MIEAFHRLWLECRPAFSERRCWEKAGQLALSNLINFGRHTIAGALTSAGRQDADWSAAYRLFERQRLDVGKLFNVPLRAVMDALPPGAPFVAALDDTILRKTGKKVHGTSWKRDPLGPKFTTNFVWAQRWLQISAALPEPDGRCRAIPVDFHHCPAAAKPGKKANADELQEYRKQQKAMSITVQAAARITQLRNRVPASRKLIISGDGGYTNRTICRSLPANTTFIGRVRKDAKLFLLPDDTDGRGRKRIYGEQLPTPEAMRLDDAVPWQEVKAVTGDKEHTFKIKIIPLIRSQLAGNDLKLIIVQPLRYRLNSKSKLMYRDPAYIISTDHNLDADKILQWYLWRWEIELNFRDEKNILGLDDAMIRTPEAVETWTPFAACSYALLLLAGRATGKENGQIIRPKWQKSAPPFRPSTNHYLSIMRQEISGLSCNLNFDGFKEYRAQTIKPFLFLPDIKMAVFTARR